MPSTGFPEPVPDGLRTAEFVLRPIAADDAELDYDALMETRVPLRLWEQSSWPEDSFTVAANRSDLAGMQERHVARRAFAYTVLNPAGTTCLGCVYVFPTTATFLTKATVTALGGARWADVDAVVYFWVRSSRMHSGLDEQLLARLRAWLREEWGLGKTGYVVSQPFTQQVELVEHTDLRRQFELREPEKPAPFFVYGDM